jgi:hypothetical protein
VKASPAGLLFFDTDGSSGFRATVRRCGPAPPKQRGIADDDLVKPVNLSDRRARLHVGVRVVTLQERLANTVTELQATLDKVRQLRGLPICSYCKRIRNDQNYWERVEVYVTEHTDAKFTHGICPTCLEAAKAEFAREDSLLSEPPRAR